MACIPAILCARCAAIELRDPMALWLNPHDPFPPVEHALDEGLLAISADLSPTRLLDAYQHGIFPWYSDGQPVLWWSPDPRMILAPQEFKISPSFRKTLKRVLRDPRWEIRVDDQFSTIMRACAEIPRRGQDGTWITPQIIDAYSSLHRLGFTHSVETWFNGACVGGLYGVSIGKMFFGESMFSRIGDASKIALATLIGHLLHHKIEMIDCQQNTPHLLSLGGREIGRKEFVEYMRAATAATPISWRFDKNALFDLV